MLSKVLAQILTDHGNCKQDGNRYLVPPESSATVYVSVGDETLTVDKVKEVVLDEEVAVLVGRDSRTITTYEDVRAVRFHIEDRRQAGLIP